jgi:hypothetical protein
MPISGRLHTIARLGAAVLLVAACGSDPATPGPATPAPTADPRLEEVAEGRGVWERQRPSTVAYTTVEDRAGGPSTVVHVTEMDGRSEVQAVTVGRDAPEVGAAQTIEGILDRAAAALEQPGGEVAITYDLQYGYVSRLDQSLPDVTDAVASVEVRDLTTAADRTSASRARAGLDSLLQAWKAPRSPTWDYTWSRFTAADTASSATTYRVHHEDGATTIAAEDGAAGSAAPPDAATIEGTVETAVGVLAAGGWVDVAADDAGLDALISIDPSPSVKGDAYWIRIDYTDLYAVQAREALAAARARWSATAPDRLSFRWRYEGPGGSWGWNVSLNGDVARLKPTAGAPAVESSFVAPRIDALFDLVEAIVDGGGRVKVTYDGALGYPTTVVIDQGVGVAPEGTITISKLKPR